MNKESAERGAVSKGKSLMLEHLAGKTLSPRQAMAAKCFDCMGGYADGRIDCKMDHCSLYPWMPYRESPVVRKTRSLSVDDRRLQGERLRKWREAKRPTP